MWLKSPVCPPLDLKKYHIHHKIGYDIDALKAPFNISLQKITTWLVFPE